MYILGLLSIVRKGRQKRIACLTHGVVDLRPIPIKLHDGNGKSERCDTEAERVELNVHDNKTGSFLVGLIYKFVQRKCDLST